MTAEQIVQAAWNNEVRATWLNKSTADPGGVPCPECRREVNWAASCCDRCGATFDEHMRRYRARIYEGLIWG